MAGEEGEGFGMKQKFWSGPHCAEESGAQCTGGEGLSGGGRALKLMASVLGSLSGGSSNKSLGSRRVTTSRQDVKGLFKGKCVTGRSRALTLLCTPWWGAGRISPGSLSRGTVTATAAHQAAWAPQNPGWGHSLWL